MPSDANAPNDSSSPMRSTAFLGGAPRTPNDIACGSGDGGAGHCPGRAAARSMRLSVRMCWLARACFSSGDKTDRGAGIDGGLGVSGFADFEIGRGGEGVRRADETGLTLSKSKGLFFWGVASNDWSDWKMPLSPEVRVRCESRLADDESIAAKSSWSDSEDSG